MEGQLCLQVLDLGRKGIITRRFKFFLGLEKPTIVINNFLTDIVTKLETNLKKLLPVKLCFGLKFEA